MIICLQEKWEGLSKFLDVILGSCKEVGKMLVIGTVV